MRQPFKSPNGRHRVYNFGFVRLPGVVYIGKRLEAPRNVSASYGLNVLDMYNYGFECCRKA